MIDDYVDEAFETKSKDRAQSIRSNLSKFMLFKPEGAKKSIGRMRAVDVTAKHFLEWIKSVRKDVSEGTIWHYYTDVQAAWRFGASTLGGHLPKDHLPMSELKRPPKPTKELLEDDLLTTEEVDAILTEAEKYGLKEFLQIQYATGARPGELCEAKVKDFFDGQFAIYKYKNGKRVGKPRRIYLQGEALKTVERLCEGKTREGHIFLGPRGAPWTTNRVGKIMREHLRAHDSVRESHTSYSFRDLFITDALRAGYPIFDVAKTVDTSVKMIEKHYGHFCRSKAVQIHAGVEQRRANARKSA